MIDKNTLISEIMDSYPDKLSVLLQNGIDCFGCSTITWETLEQAAQKHDIKIDELIKNLNKNIRR